MDIHRQTCLRLSKREIAAWLSALRKSLSNFFQFPSARFGAVVLSSKVWAQDPGQQWQHWQFSSVIIFISPFDATINNGLSMFITMVYPTLRFLYGMLHSSYPPFLAVCWHSLGCSQRVWLRKLWPRIVTVWHPYTARLSAGMRLFARRPLATDHCTGWPFLTTMHIYHIAIMMQLLVPIIISVHQTISLMWLISCFQYV